MSDKKNWTEFRMKIFGCDSSWKPFEKLVAQSGRRHFFLVSMYIVHTHASFYFRLLLHKLIKFIARNPNTNADLLIPLLHTEIIY